MEERELSLKVLEEIKDKKISPKPKWNFLLKSYTMWALFGLAIVIGSLSTSIILFLVFNSRIPEELTWLQHLVILFPYFWVIVLVIFLFIAWFNFSHTEKGYRYNSYVVILASVLISLIFGSSIYILGGAEDLEELFYSKIPIYKILIHSQDRILIDQDNGRIAGIARDVNTTYLILQDFSGKVWIVSYPTSTPPFKSGNRLLVYGEKISEEEFRAKLIQALHVKKRNRDMLLAPGTQVPSGPLPILEIK